MDSGAMEKIAACVPGQRMVRQRGITLDRRTARHWVPILISYLYSHETIGSGLTGLPEDQCGDINLGVCNRRHQPQYVKGCASS